MPFRLQSHRIMPPAALRPPNAVRAGRKCLFPVETSPASRSRSEISGSDGVRRAWIGCVVMLLCSRSAPAADKVDVVHLKNGDRITCEIKELDRSVLSISTDPLGNVSVHWGEVLDLRSPRKFDVQIASGMHYLGAFLASPPGQMVLALDGGGTITVALADLIRMAPIGASVWSRIDGNLDAGFSFAQAQHETHWTVNGSASYRSLRYQLTANVASQITTREEDNPISRNSCRSISALSAGAGSGATWCTRHGGCGPPTPASRTRTSSSQATRPISRLKSPSAGSSTSLRLPKRTSA
jgi:hypothetical protein